ncbi:MAG: beta-N-acetylhexosaminidase [Alphaproteobacteria bacterium]|nr:beta-N-acetylhexosaminidase [Alphaproteobacteria bacterium]
MQSAFITGLAGCDLTPGEQSFLAETRPAGIILFARNCQSHAQIRKLVSDATAAIGASEILVLIDQEGGRVQRLRPPLGRLLPPAGAFGKLFEHDRDAAVRAAGLVFRLLASDLRELGINMDCAPVLDVPVKGAHGIIGDRAYGGSVDKIAMLGRAVAEGLMAGGVVPVVKHIPGHGRAMCDSHFDLPVVNADLEQLRRSDFAPFRELSDMPSAMTAHVVYPAIDPELPITTSRIGIQDVVRGEIGFDGLLMSDDLSMKALSGPMLSRAEAAIGAGCDVALHCNGDLAEMRAVAAGVPSLQGEALRRFEAAIEVTRRCDAFERGEAEAVLGEVLAGV